MKAVLNRRIICLQALFVSTGLVFAIATILFLIAHFESPDEYFSSFSGSVWDIIAALTPIFTGLMALIYLVPMFIGFTLSKFSAQLFEFLSFISRASIYFPLAPGIILLAVYLACAMVFDSNLLLPASANLEDICAYIFTILLYVAAILMFISFKLSRKLR